MGTFDWCRDKGECFAGALFISINHLIDHPSLSYRNVDFSLITKQTRCEDATYWFLHHQILKNKKRGDKFGKPAVQTVDVMDFSVIHLSTAERLLEKWAFGILRGNKTSEILSLIEKMSKLYNKRNSFNNKKFHESSPASISMQREHQMNMDSVLVIIPFLLSEGGMGGSEQRFRKKYLQLTFYSLFPLFKHIVGVVRNAKDFIWARNSSLLPFYDVWLLEDLPTTCALPLASLLEAKRRLLGSASTNRFRYIYFTEADQILLFARSFGSMFSYINKNAYSAILPHRLVLPPPSFLTHEKINQERILDLTPLSLYEGEGPVRRTIRCCLDTESNGERLQWKKLNQTQIVRIHGSFNVILANANFHSQVYRSCNISYLASTSPCPMQSTRLSYFRKNDSNYYRDN